MSESSHFSPEAFGSRVFNDDVMRERLPSDVYHSIAATIATGSELDPGIADVVAAAMKDWAVELGATHYTHWFQPLTGVTAEKHEAFLTPLSRSRVLLEFSGKELIRGESDASSFPSGGLRATFEARGYTAWDPASSTYVKDGTLFIPTVFCSYTGEALDTKTPLIRSIDSLSREAVRILRLFGDAETARVDTVVGAEQEYFLIDKADYDARRDLFYTGRTLFGAPAPKGQQLDDHYFGPLKTRVGAFMAELDRALWELGIPAKTKHNEVAPSQHELAPVYTSANLAIDQNLLMMETMKHVAEKHGMVCLLHEKPFAGINGSGKHNNWSLSTDTGKNLIKPGKKPAEDLQFLLFLTAVIAAVDDYQDLLRLSVASASNDHRLGANEAPPAIVSIFLGDDLTRIVDAIIAGEAHQDVQRSYVDLHSPSIPMFLRDTTDRNRTSPFAFTGNKFEFRMVGSSQNIAMPNIVLNTAVAESLRHYADALTGAEDLPAAVKALLRQELKAHARIIFNGNGYSQEWAEEAARRGLSIYPTSVDVFPCLTAEKNVRLFESHGVLSRKELTSRREILFENYEKVMNIEACTMIDMAMKDYIPSVNAYIRTLADEMAAKQAAIGAPCQMEKALIARLSELTDAAFLLTENLKAEAASAASLADTEAAAVAFKERVIPVMESLRRTVDAMEEYTAIRAWPMPTYGQMTFGVR